MVTVLLSMSDKYSQKKQERRTSKFFWTHGNEGLDWVGSSRCWWWTISLGFMSKGLYKKKLQRRCSVHLSGGSYQSLAKQSMNTWTALFTPQFSHPLFASSTWSQSFPVSKSLWAMSCRSVKYSSGRSSRFSFVYMQQLKTRAPYFNIIYRNSREECQSKICRRYGSGYLRTVSAARRVYSHCFSTLYFMISSCRTFPKRSFMSPSRWGIISLVTIQVHFWFLQLGSGDRAFVESHAGGKIVTSWEPDLLSHRVKGVERKLLANSKGCPSRTC